MSPEVLTTSFSILLFSMVVGWFVLLRLFFNRIERAHPRTYEAMGSPSLFLRLNIVNGWATLKFIAAREHRTLNDNYLTRLSNFMLVYFVVFQFFFWVMFYISVAGSSSPAA